MADAARRFAGRRRRLHRALHQHHASRWLDAIERAGLTSLPYYRRPDRRSVIGRPYHSTVGLLGTRFTLEQAFTVTGW